MCICLIASKRPKNDTQLARLGILHELCISLGYFVSPCIPSVWDVAEPLILPRLLRSGVHQFVHDSLVTLAQLMPCISDLI